MSVNKQLLDAAKSLMAALNDALPHMDTAHDGIGPDCTKQFQALVDGSAAIAAAEQSQHHCKNCEGVQPETCVFNADQAQQAGPEPEPFGYFMAAPFGWTDCEKDDEGAIALYERPQAQPVARDVHDELPDAVIDATAEAIGSAYDCMRAWSAWSVGTMGPDDFWSVAEDGDRVADIARAAIVAWNSYADQPPAVAVPQEAADSIRSPFNACCNKEHCRAMLAAAPQAAVPAQLPPYNVFSNDDGDSWETHPASDNFVHGLHLGEEFELLAGWQAERVTFRVTKVPDAENDDYEVEEVTTPAAAQKGGA